ncbi:MAG: type I DNA topoisomerase [Clostridia bacterium]|nr:type I DNA topoisomerase [Clostridia bacterium]
MSKNLVIVESPAKAKTIKKYLGKDFKIEASYGHVRDLPDKFLGVDIENGFIPKYQTITGKKKVIDKLKEASKDVDRIYLATDPDREGEAIAMHIATALKIPVENQFRITFNEITKKAVSAAILEPSKVNVDMFNSYQARRILDRIVGYKISPILWKKIKKGLSAGRVQSVAVKLICDREEEIKAFVPEEYWDINIEVSPEHKKDTFIAKYFGNEKKVKVVNEAQAMKIVEDTKKANLIISNIKVSEKVRRPSPPFITSTLQQEASNKLGFTTKKTMQVAQSLYEGVSIGELGSIGLITYMRTDSTRISADIQLETRKMIEKMFGSIYLPKTIPVYKNKKNTQDAHEAIRPTQIDLLPQNIKDSLTSDQIKLYKLIFDRFVASQMASAKFENTSVSIKADEHIFKASGSTILFKGYQALYEVTEIKSKDVDEDDAKNTFLPKLSKNDLLNLIKIDQNQKFTQPPYRYTEASLVKVMEEMGIGRPSTYSPTISTIITREYVERDKKFLVPTETGTVVNEIMKKHFEKIVDYSFTTEMEDSLDNIENGETNWQSVLESFYIDFSKTLIDAEKNIEKMTLKQDITDVKCENCGKLMIIKSGRYGKFLACPGYPECKTTKPYTEPTDMKCPLCGKNVFIKYTKTNKKYIGCEDYPTCQFSSWDLPTDIPCPKCGNTLLKTKINYKEHHKCSSPTCDYVEEVKKNNEKSS